jgi:hypothetical protein
VGSRGKAPVSPEICRYVAGLGARKHAPNKYLTEGLAHCKPILSGAVAVGQRAKPISDRTAGDGKTTS